MGGLSGADGCAGMRVWNARGAIDCSLCAHGSSTIDPEAPMINVRCGVNGCKETVVCAVLNRPPPNPTRRRQRSATPPAKVKVEHAEDEEP